MENQNGQYGHRPWNDDEDTAAEPRVDYGVRFTDREKELTTKAISSVTMPGDYLADIVRPELPQVALFRPKYGYRTRQLGVADVMNADSIYSDSDDFGFEGTNRNSQSGVFW